MKIIYSSEILESLTKKDKKKYWCVHITTKDNKIFSVQKEYWQDGSKHQTSAPKECKPKNVGKSNETSSKDQAFKEVESLIKKQKDKDYLSAGEVSTKDPYPMLAQKYDDKKDKIKYPASGQPKFDGIRALDKSDYYYTRENRPFIKEITQHINIDTQGYILDGELLIPGAEFEVTVSAVKKYSELSKQLVYYVYDIIIPDKTFTERWEILEKLFKQKGIKNVELSPIYPINKESDIKKLHKKCVKEKYEGLMIRNNDSLYLAKYRSNDLLKFKTWITEEFKVIDIKEGVGNHKGAGTFVCKDSRGEEFEAKPKGSMEQAREYFTNKQNYIGKMLTVKYQNLTKRGVPRFPTALVIRDYE